MSSVRAQPAQAVKEEPRAAAPPQMEPPHIPIPGMMQGEHLGDLVMQVVAEAEI